MPWRSRQSSPITSLQTEMNRVLEQFFTPTLAPSMQLGRGSGSVVPVVPALDVREDEKEIVVTVELPGTRREDVEISIQDDVLEIRGHKAEEKREEQENFYLCERSFGSFTRRVVLPTEVDSATAEAKLENGVLTLHLPKTGPKPGKKSIEVH